MSKSAGQIKSVKQEKRITRSLQQIGMEAKVQMASGAKWFAKSDVVSDLFQIEAKTKAKPSKSITVKKEWLDKIELEAFENGRTAITAISMGDHKDYFIIRDIDFLPLIEELMELRKSKGELAQ